MEAQTTANEQDGIFVKSEVTIAGRSRRSELRLTAQQAKDPLQLRAKLVEWAERIVVSYVSRKRPIGLLRLVTHEDGEV